MYVYEVNILLFVVIYLHIKCMILIITRLRRTRFQTRDSKATKQWLITEELFYPFYLGSS